MRSFLPAATTLAVITACAVPVHGQARDGVHLDSIAPPDGSTDVPLSASINLRFSGSLDPTTLAGLTLHRQGEGPEPAVALAYSTDLTNASITLNPQAFLLPSTTYEVRGGPPVRSPDGAALTPFVRRFTTGSDAAPDDALVFSLSTFDNQRSMTTVAFGPDGRLYAADAFGNLFRWDIDQSGKPHDRTLVVSDPAASRQYIDLEWDPAATADDLVLWASYGDRTGEPGGPRTFFSGTIAKLTLGDEGVGEEIVVHGLPHGREEQGGFRTLPHQPNGLVFHDGMLYQSVGSTSSSGGPANWGITEQPLSACCLEIDYRSLTSPLDVAPDSGFDASAPGSPVRIFATGIRNALELVSHSNGRLYTAVNLNDRAGPGDGVPDHPDIPGDQNVLVTGTTPDQESLLIVERDRHYGFPNPSRGQFVLNGGNPTAGHDPFEIEGYPVGTLPDDGFAPELMFPIWQHGGTSPNGMIEYRPSSDSPLSGCLLCCFYSAGDIAVMAPGAGGLPNTVKKLRLPDGKLALSGPLDITQDPRTGILYVANFGKQSTFGEDGSMVMLVPARPARPGGGPDVR